MTQSKIITLSLLGGLLSAAFSASYLVPIPGFVVFSYFSSLPLFLIGLGAGLRPLCGAGLVATLLALLIEAPIAAGEFFCLSALGSAFLVSRALLHRETSSSEISWYPASYLLRDFSFAIGAVALCFLGIYLYLTDGGDAQAFVKSLLTLIDPQGHLKDSEGVLVKAFPFLPGFFAFSWAFMMLINGCLAQGILVRFKQNLRPSPTFENLTVPKTFLFAFALFLLLSFVGVGHISTLGKNGAFVIAFPFLLIGLGVIHRWIHKTSYPTIGLTLFYFLVGLFIWPLLIVILLGILKPWIEKSA